MFDSLYNWVISVWTSYGDTIIEVGKFLFGLFSIGFSLWKVIQKQVQKYSFIIAIVMNIIFILFPFIRLVSSDEPFGRIDVALIAFYVFCLMSVIFMCLILKSSLKKPLPH